MKMRIWLDALIAMLTDHDLAKGLHSNSYIKCYWKGLLVHINQLILFRTQCGGDNRFAGDGRLAGNRRFAGDIWWGRQIWYLKLGWDWDYRVKHDVCKSQKKNPPACRNKSLLSIHRLDRKSTLNSSWESIVKFCKAQSKSTYWVCRALNQSHLRKLSLEVQTQPTNLLH